MLYTAWHNYHDEESRATGNRYGIKYGQDYNLEGGRKKYSDPAPVAPEVTGE